MTIVLCPFIVFFSVQEELKALELQKQADEQSYLESQIEIENQRIKSEIEDLENLIKNEGGDIEADVQNTDTAGEKKDTCPL